MLQLPQISWRAYQPLATFLLALVTGISLASLGVGSSFVFGFSACILLGLWLTGRAIERGGASRWNSLRWLQTLWLLTATVMVGGLLYTGSAAPWQRHDRGGVWDGKARPLVLKGTVLDVPERIGRSPQPWMSESIWRYRIRVEQVRKRERWVPCLATLEVRESGEFNDRLPGDECRWTGHLELNRPARNPGMERGGGGDPRRPVAGWLIVPANHPPVVLGWRTAFPDRGFAGWRRSADRRLKRVLSGEAYAIARALTLGLRDELSPGVTELFQEAGIAHLLAISGFHVGILMVVFITPAVHLGLDRRAAFWALLLVLLIYLGVSGMRPSVLRAILCVVLTLGLRLRQRRPNTSVVLFCVAALLLVGDARLSRDLGAQLSFLGVYLLGHTSGPPTVEPFRWIIQRTCRQWSLGWRSLYQGCTQVVRGLEATLLVVLGMQPLVAYHFQCVAAAGLIVNPLAVIPSSILLVASLVLTLPFFGPLASVFMVPLVEISYAALVMVAEVGRGLIPSRFTIGPSAALLCSGYLALLAADRIAFRMGCRWPWWLGLILLNCVVLSEPEWARGVRWLQGDASRGRVTVMDVAHGTAVMIESGRGEVWMYDAGSASGARFSSRVVLQWLRHRRVPVISRWFLSHPDRDHFNGCAELIGRVPVQEIVVPEAFRDADDDAWQYLLQRCRSKGIPVVYCRRGDAWDDGFNLKCRVLHPDGSVRHSKDNNQSLVMEVELAGRRILLTGDVEGPVSRRLAAEAGECDVLLVPHHGGVSSDVQAWLSLTQPEWVFVSSNRPELSCIELGKGTGARRRAPLRNTACHGAITIQWDSGRAKVSSWLEK